MSNEQRQERVVLIGLIGLFCAVGLMLAFVSIFGGGLAGE